MNRSETLTKLVPALIEAAREFAPALKNAENPHFRSKFVDLGGVNAAIDAALLKHGLIALQPTRIGDDGRTIVETTVFHESGEFLGGEYPVTAVKQNDPQAEGSGLTYARRYALMALVGIAPEDDDAETAMRRNARANATPEVDPELANDFLSQIDRASSVDELIAVGAALAKSAVPAKPREALRVKYTAKLEQLRAA